MRTTVRWLASGMLGLAAAGCGHDTHISIGSGRLTVDGQQLTLTHDGAPDAHVGADGSLRIGTGAVTVTDGQRAHLAALYRAAAAVNDHALATGKAGAAVGAEAVGAVAEGLAHGDASQIGARVEAKADAVRRAAGKLCDDLATLRQEQQAVAAEIAAFRPYEAVGVDSISDCRRDAAPTGAG